VTSVTHSISTRIKIKSYKKDATSPHPLHQRGDVCPSLRSKQALLVPLALAATVALRLDRVALAVTLVAVALVAGVRRAVLLRLAVLLYRAVLLRRAVLL